MKKRIGRGCLVIMAGVRLTFGWLTFAKVYSIPFNFKVIFLAFCSVLCTVVVESIGD